MDNVKTGMMTNAAILLALDVGTGSEQLLRRTGSLFSEFGSTQTDLMENPNTGLLKIGSTYVTLHVATLIAKHSC